MAAILGWFLGHRGIRWGVEQGLMQLKCYHSLIIHNHYQQSFLERQSDVKDARWILVSSPWSAHVHNQGSYPPLLLVGFPWTPPTYHPNQKTPHSLECVFLDSYGSCIHSDCKTVWAEFHFPFVQFVWGVAKSGWVFLTVWNCTQLSCEFGTQLFGLGRISFENGQKDWIVFVPFWCFLYSNFSHSTWT